MEKTRKNTFDVVFLCHSLEHLEKPFESLKLIRSKLKKEGKIIIILPIEKHKKVDFRLDRNQHLFCWNFRTINNLLIKTGFKIIKNEYFRGAVGYKKLLFLSKISPKVYDFFTNLIRPILGSKQMRIVAVKKD